MNEAGQLTAEQRARAQIDRQLTEAGWSVQNRTELNLFAGQGVAVREVIMRRGHGRADYLLYVDRRAVGVIEAKPEGVPLSGVEWQSAMYAEGPAARVSVEGADPRRPPAVFEASGVEIHFTNGFALTDRLPGRLPGGLPLRGLPERQPGQLRHLLGQRPDLALQLDDPGPQLRRLRLGPLGPRPPALRLGTPEPDATTKIAVAAHDRARRSPSAPRVQHPNPAWRDQDIQQLRHSYGIAE